MKKHICALLLAATISLQGYAQSADDWQTVKFTVAQAPEWTKLLNRGDGWFGADGIYTIPLNGQEGKPAGKNDKTLLIFSDTMIGTVRDNTLAPGSRMIHNSAAILKGNVPDEKAIQFYWDKNAKNEAEPLFVPTSPATKKGEYFWLGDGFVNKDQNNSLYIFGYRIFNVSEEAFGFREVGNTLIKLNANDVPKFTNQKQEDTPLYLLDNKGDIGSFGAGIYANTKSAGAPDADGYIYVYGVRGMAKQLVLARVPAKSFDDFKQWRYWDGSNWQTDINSLVNITDKVSNELSVTRLADGRFALVFQVNGMSPFVGMRIGKSLTGPFGPIIKLWDCSKDLAKKSYTVYNAKAHPTLSKPGELLISYNINSVEFLKDLQEYPNLYRPRFIRVKFE
ncbi:hypothetical protein GCM10023149_11010 [Mucilaginibacter gynuensis]|uniref:DUF4185 domain-containing protein n=1 Tax=Mucilaginibacter gynuensis TaxID=1302236 RepID=A0ABP8G0C5_9SPHI